MSPITTGLVINTQQDNHQIIQYIKTIWMASLQLKRNIVLHNSELGSIKGKFQPLSSHKRKFKRRLGLKQLIKLAVYTLIVYCK